MCMFVDCSYNMELYKCNQFKLFVYYKWCELSVGVYIICNVDMF